MMKSIIPFLFLAVVSGVFLSGCREADLPDDFEPKGPTYQYMVVCTEASPNMSGVGNQADGDKPLALLYRRFTRQFDISEKFFPGDNSRPEVVEHRRKYKAAAGNTWKIIEYLLRPEPPRPNHPMQWRLLHRAVQRSPRINPRQCEW